MAPKKHIKKVKAKPKFNKNRRVAKAKPVPFIHKYAHLEKFKADRWLKQSSRVAYASPGNSYSQCELLMHITKFDNYQPKVAIDANPAEQAYSFSFQTNENYLFNNDSDTLGGTQGVRLRVKSYKVFAFPEVVRGQAANGTLYKTSEFQYGIFAAVPCETNGTTNTAVEFAHQQATTIQPSATPTWQLVLDVDCDKLFDYSNLQPSLVGLNTQRLFVLSGFDLVNGSPLTGSIPQASISLPIRVEVSFYHPVKLATAAAIAIEYLPNANSIPSVSGTDEFAIPSISKVVQLD
jgi:hypothetical protein